MLIRWEINRYARCYSDSSKQCLDSDQTGSIFQYFAHLDTQRSHAIGNFWSAINKCDQWKLNIFMNLKESRQIEFSINLIEASKTVVLEKLIFPKDFSLKFKISSRKESIGFRYNIDGKKFLFQAFFDCEYECHLCFDSFCRYGLFSGHWSDPFQFIKYDLKQEKDDDQAKNEKEIPINLTPEFTFNNLPDFVKANRSLLPSSDQLKTERMHREDPDVTQLEIDISSASLTAPYSQNRLCAIVMSNLGTKESGLFKTAIQLYEIKQYKKGLKTCEQILTKYPEHGETLALKGLFLLFLDKREEGFDTCKNGLKLSLQSHISWHILGLMHRQDKNYEEAIKCYKNALRIDKNNFQILRDLALLQLQCRQLEGAIDTRRKIVFARPSSPFNWISLVIIYHLSGNLKHALELMNIYLELFGSIKDAAENHRFYKVSLMMELGIYKEAINYLQTSLVKQNTRRFYETLAEAAFNAKEYALCEENLLKLIEINPDCREYLVQLFNIYNIENKEVNNLVELIREKSLLAAVQMLSLVDEDIFNYKAPSIFKSIMARGSPATFQLFKSTFHDEGRRKLIWSTLLELDQDNLSVIIFKVKYLAMIKDYSNALSLINSAIDSNSENTDLKLIKAHVQKSMGCLNDAHETVSVLKELDLISNDKFSVSKSAKYMIRYGLITEAQEILGNFIQKPNQKERIGDLHEMQAIWYLIEMADRLFKNGEFLYSACFYRKIEMIFAEFIDDQLDFHGYSLRRMSFVEYMKFLRFLDNELKTSEILKRSLVGLSRCILNLSISGNDVDELTKKFDSAKFSSDFADDLSVHIEFFRSLLSSAKGLDEFLQRICNNLISYYPEDLVALESALSICEKLNFMLTAQKIATRLIERGVNVSDIVINRINKQRFESCSLWANVPFLN